MSYSAPTTKPPSRLGNRINLGDLVSLVPFGLGVFLMGGGVGIAVKLSVTQIMQGHVRDVINDFSLYRTLLFGSLAYGFNFCFGCAMGLAYYRRRRVGNAGFLDATLFRVVNPAVLLFVLWWLIFNGPVILFRTPEPLPWFLKTLAFLGSLYYPLRNDLYLYFYMGNFALIGSFLFAISMGKFWNRIFPPPADSSDGDTPGGQV